MKNISLDSILLFALTVPFIMTYRISWAETPFFLFGLIFLALLSYLVLDVLRLNRKTYEKAKVFLLWAVLLVVLGSTFVSAMIVRHQTAPVYMVHDIVLQQESAIRFFLDGINPYATSYFGTPLEKWHYSETEVNPALYHFVMQPFYLLFALPFYFLTVTLFGFFDGRMPLLFLLFLLLFLAWRLPMNADKKRLFLILLALNPATIGYTLEGRSDIFMFAFLFLGFYLLEQKKFFLSVIPTALAFAVKQSAWPLLPFYAAFLYFKIKSVRLMLLYIALFLVTFVSVVGPFLLWDGRAFLDSTVFYLSGTAPNSYPISGYGLGMLLREIGVIGDAHQYYPFHIWQAGTALPLLIVLIQFLRRVPSVSRLILVYGIFLFVFWYLSRYLNNSHLGYLSMVFITAYFWPNEKS